MDHESHVKERAYAWSQFKFQSEQRAGSFRLYVILAVSLLTISVLAESAPFSSPTRLVSIVPFMVVLLSVVFRRIDTRRRRSIRRATDALIYLEKLPGAFADEPGSSVMNFFDREMSEGGPESESPMPLFHTETNYSLAIDATFLVFAVVGLGLGIHYCG